jgi:biopolymer transport protein ExbD
MKYIVVLMLLVLIAGCQTQESASTASSPPTTGHDSGQMIVTVEASGDARVGTLSASSKDWPDVVKQWHITSAVVKGVPGAKLSDMLRVEEELKNAGVADVTLAQPESGG